MVREIVKSTIDIRVESIHTYVQRIRLDMARTTHYECLCTYCIHYHMPYGYFSCRQGKEECMVQLIKTIELTCASPALIDQGRQPADIRSSAWVSGADRA